jgi:hypothetical protein
MVKLNSEDCFRSPCVSKLSTDNEMLAEFSKPNFDVKEKVRSILQGTDAVGVQLQHLTNGVELVEKELKTQVSDHYEDLLSQATGVEKLERVLNVMVTKSDALISSVERIRSKVVGPYERMEEQTVLVARLQESCDLLRRIIRTLNISKRLQQQLAGGQNKEITKAAQSLNELDYLARDVDLSGLVVLEKDQRLIKQARQQVEKQAETTLAAGIDSQNQTQVATALQVFYNLGILPETIDKLLSTAIAELEAQVTATFDVKAMTQANSESVLSKTASAGKVTGSPGRSTMPTPGQAAAFRAALWLNIEKLFDFIHQSCVKMNHLYKVLSKKRDPVTGVGFLEELADRESGKTPLIEVYWRGVTQVLASEFTKAAQTSSFVKQSFEGEYPKLLRLCGDLWKKLAALADVTPFQSGATETAGKFEPEKALREVLSSFENSYLSRSLSRLFDPVNLMFDGLTDAGPKKEEVDACVKAIASELRVAAVDPYLCTIVARNVAKTVKLFAVKIENLAVPGDSSSVQVVSTPSSVQKLNASLVEVLFYLKSQIEARAVRGTPFPAPVRQIVADSLKDVELLMQSIVNPWFEAIGKALRSIIATIHYEDFTDDSIKKSAYVEELEAFIARVRASYFVLFNECGPDFVAPLIATIIRKTITDFILHVSLVRSLDSKGNQGEFAIQLRITITTESLKCLDVFA